MPNETKCPECGGLCEETLGECAGGEPRAYRTIAAERAEREAWERHCPKCKHKTPTGHCIKLEERHTVSDVSFDTCPLRPCNKGKGEA